MATINLGKVKGEPFRYEDFTHEQLEALKGKDFKYEDFSPEQLDKLKSKVKIGTVETLDADQEATVTSSVDGNVTTLNIGIPRGNGVNSYSGTREEYNNIADTIKDGSLVNITDENDFDDENLIGQVTMQRLNDIEDNFDNIKPHALTNPTNNLLATEPGTPLDAVQGKVLNDKVTVQEELDNIFHLTVSGSNKNISKILSDAGIDSDLTFQENMELLKNISVNRELKSISIFTNSNSSAFNTSLPVSSGGILEVHYPKYNRRIFKFYSYKTADVYVNYELDRTYGTWQKLITETELNTSIRKFNSDVFNNGLLWRGQPASGTDLNTLTQISGFYWISNIKNMVNYPNGIGTQGGVLIVFKNTVALRVVQVFIGANSIFFRIMPDGVSFLPWYKIAGTVVE
jgi:hypothetical protein